MSNHGKGGTVRTIPLAAGYVDGVDQYQLERRDRFPAHGLENPATPLLVHATTGEMIDVNPMDEIERAKVPRDRPKSIEDDHVAARLLAAAADQDPAARAGWPARDIVVAATLVTTGVRLAELVALNEGSITGEPGAWKLDVYGKGGTVRTIPLAAGYVDGVDQYQLERRNRFPAHGLYRQSDGFVYLRNSNSQGIADVRYFFGDADGAHLKLPRPAEQPWGISPSGVNAGDVPIAGDFDGDGCGTVSLYRPSEGRVYVHNKLGSGDAGLGAAELAYYFGNPGDKPFTGDFDRDGIDTVGLHRESTGLVSFRNSQTAGIADVSFIYGDPDDRFVAGDWTGDGIDTAGLFRPADTKFYFRNTNTQGIADGTLVWGDADWLPVAGSFDLN